LTDFLASGRNPLATFFLKHPRSFCLGPHEYLAE
jgi:hypothetical protein